MILQYIRDGLIEEEHIAEFSDGERTNGSPYYLRSCAKPLQASLMVDFDMPKEFELTSAEIALICASHAGEESHVRLAQSLLDKFGLTLENLKCGIHRPISKSADFKLRIEGVEPNELYNNCIGKHLLFLALCKINDWDLTDYDNINHPLQKLVKERINSLCEVEYSYPQTKDGCGVPILSMPLFNMVRGYKNLFSSPKYALIKKAFLDNPYIIGGENRLDTEIMQNSNTLIAKVGAGGLCIVYNTQNKKSIGLKIKDCSMDARRFAILEILNRLGWGCFKYDNTIKTLHGEIVGEIHLNATKLPACDCR